MSIQQIQQQIEGMEFELMAARHCIGSYQSGVAVYPASGDSAHDEQSASAHAWLAASRCVGELHQHRSENQ